MSDEKRILFFCEVCNFKKIQKDVEGFYELKVSDIPRGIPYLDKDAKKTIVPEVRKAKRRFRCPNCGRVIFPKVVK